MKEKILEEITNFCEECPSHENCPESECVLYRIEQKVTKKLYQVEIRETLCKIIDIEAESEADAIDIVEDKYRNEEIVLDADDYAGTKIDIFRSGANEK